jgi:hypothetical protein
VGILKLLVSPLLVIASLLYCPLRQDDRRQTPAKKGQRNTLVIHHLVACATTLRGFYEEVNYRQEL